MRTFNEQIFDGYLSAMLEMAVDEDIKDIREDLGYSVTDFQKASLNLLRSTINEFISANKKLLAEMSCEDWETFGCDLYFAHIGTVEPLYLSGNCTEEQAEQIEKLAAEIQIYDVKITKNKKKLKLKKLIDKIGKIGLR